MIFGLSLLARLLILVLPSHDVVTVQVSSLFLSLDRWTCLIAAISDVANYDTNTGLLNSARCCVLVGFTS